MCLFVSVYLPTYLPTYLSVALQVCRQCICHLADDTINLQSSRNQRLHMLCEISDFCRGVTEAFALLGCYTDLIQLVADVSGNPISSIFKGPVVENVDNQQLTTPQSNQEEQRPKQDVCGKHNSYFSGVFFGQTHAHAHIHKRTTKQFCGKMDP